MFLRLWIAAIASASLAACGGSSSEQGSGASATPAAAAPGYASPGAAPAVLAAPAVPAAPGLAAGFDVGEVKSPAAYLAEPRFAAADLKRGELLSLACQACHTLRAGQAPIIGPNLYGMFGRQIATVPDFKYSDALLGADLVWTPRALEAWLAEPQRFIVGNNMAFSGFNGDNDRRDVIAFLLTATAPPAVE
jgi:cytochrome c